MTSGSNESTALEHESSQACPGCGTPFVCGVAAGHQTCWCMERAPVAVPDEAGGKCYCPACLERFSAADSAAAATGSRRG